jgi:hypothetical protein
MRFRSLAAAAGCALLLSSAAIAAPGKVAAGSAQPPSPGIAAQPRVYTTDEIAADAAYGFCPLFLSNTFSLTGPELAERGFSPTVLKQPNPRFGETQVVTAKRADGEVSFGGAPGQVCTVVVSGDKRGAALARLAASMSWTGLDFKPAPNTGPTLPDVVVHTFQAPLKEQVLVLQLIEVGGSTPSVIAQLFVTAAE